MSDITLDVGLAYKIKQALIRNQIADLADLDWLATGDNCLKLRKLRLGSKQPEVSRDIVCVDRSKPVMYPDGYVPQYTLLPAGPSVFALNSLELFLHDNQKTGRVTGDFLHKYLRDSEMLAGCLGLIELLEIQKLGVDTFRKHFAGKVVFGWRDVARGGDGNLHVPYLLQDGAELCLYWFRLDEGWLAMCPALRFGK
ncbi:hypothetical protein A3C89_03110 [Candidatus Kaiserbacteria bacterium RIFCSPHIGHO2_02_FULL_50_50]|uniref:Uncharacterized protein n=1 Tax=Candidatus Kaiserbacteria bacterium RIFCSPHIGHO2_02_FULL_50_50 TaxID=1798492 RepID=A0A1F6DEQ4_9BACT|nr:MAG: hypothetical protein A3C89_03110 [Candidatus Kaiserbacteria bacterium RIFCSPHIGHO2_02_FULL_50_50]OGG89086.1 MAG: hypothetical protein A3G62_02140 [Candidatus Kaiserbacteria bacterium RIFCSPLOWO2_12_FULL_50_10]